MTVFLANLNEAIYSTREMNYSK